MKKISERQAAIIINVTPKTLLNWRKKGLIPQNLYEEKRFLEGNMRVFYNKDIFLVWWNKIKSSDNI